MGTMRKLGAALLIMATLVTLAGCVQNPTDVPTDRMYCSPADDGQIADISTWLGGSTEIYNPSVVVVNSNLRVVAFGHDKVYLSAYLQDRQHRWLVYSDRTGEASWDATGLSGDLLARARDALKIAVPCAQGG